MKNLIFIFFCSLSIALFAGNNKPDKAKEAKAKEWLNNQPLEFIENKGQFTTTDGKAADNVLFKTSFGNCDIYITDKGLSYVFVKIEEGSPKSENSREEREDLKPKFGEKEQEENKKVSYYRLDMDLIGANIDKANILKEAESKQGHFNYFYAHCPQGIYDVKAYGKITIKNIYKGIDWVIYTNSDSKEHPLKYDFVVHPGADYKAIQIKFLNAQSTTLTDNDTKLKIQTIAGNIEEGNLYSYQANESKKSSFVILSRAKNLIINSKYKINKDSIISFEITEYDTTKTLIIDPLVWAKYYGGNSIDFAFSICIDNQDNIYISGSSGSSNFPTQQLSGAFYQGNNALNFDLIILKFNNQGVRQWATYYGGYDDDFGNSICLDSQNNIYISGSTLSINFPLCQFAGAYWQPNNLSQAFCKQTVFILKFDSQGIRKWATYYGGEGQEYVNKIGVDSQDNLYIVGTTTSGTFPVQQLAGAYWQGNISCGIGTAFILKFNNQGIRQWATYYGGHDLNEFSSICIDSQDNIYITGYTDASDFPTQQMLGAYWQSSLIGHSNIVLLKFNNNGVRQWSTYYGAGSDIGISICLDSKENIYITGYTFSTNFPTQQIVGAYWQPGLAGAYDAFILKFNHQGIRQYATYYGGNDYDSGRSIHADKNDYIYVVGETYSINFPIHQKIGEYWQASNLGYEATFILKFNDQSNREWATYYGGSITNYGTSIAVDQQNAVYITGFCYDSCLYTKDYGNNAYYDTLNNGDHDIYILKIEPLCKNQNLTSIQSNRNNLCINDNGNITLTAIGGIGDTLKWYSGSCGQNYLGQNSPLIIPAPNQPTIYYARWESDCDSSNCEKILINVISPPQINLANDIIICKGIPLLLDATYPNSTYLWQDNSTNPTYNVSQQGLYWVKVSIDSCRSIDSINVIVDDCEIILEIPNFFSPNNDNVNDVFHPSKIKGIQSMNTLIYNRWGNLVFTSDELMIQWDGKTNKGDKVADGVYYWIVNYSDRNNNTMSKNESVTVMR